MKRIGLKLFVMLSLAALIAAGGPLPSAIAQDAVSMIPSDFSGIAEKVRPGVVNIRTVKTLKEGGPVFRHFFGGPGGRSPFGGRDPFREFFGPFMDQDPHQEFKQRSLGSGFIIDRDGYIVTNNHVIDGADDIKVRLANEKEYDAKVVGRDPNTDLALIRIENAEDLTPLKLGDSNALKVGTWVVAIGSPFGLEQTVTAGIVSAKGRIIGSGPYDDFIQTDASINPGNSGGPLVNLKGEVVGINTAIVASGQGIGFAIPIDMVGEVIAQLKESGQVTRGWLGVGIQNLTPELADYYKLEKTKGVLVVKVYDGDPAGKAGVQVNDIIVAVNGQPVTTSHELSRRIAALPVGEKAKIELIRDGKTRKVEVTLAKRDEGKLAEGEEAEETEAEDLGMRLGPLDEQTARRLGYDKDESGALVTDVDPDGKAAEAGVRPGDLVKELNHHLVASPEAFNKALEKIGQEKSLELLVKRRGAGFVVIKIEK
jgi:serine protease Do